MKKLLGGLVTAFSMYTAIPMPQIPWTDSSMKYALCFFPLVGALIGGLGFLWYHVCVWWGLGAALFGGGLTLIPLVITGGIHLDGFLDTSDGIHSHQPAPRKLEILKDPHVGAFGVIRCGMYLIAFFALSSALFNHPMLLAAFSAGFVLSRGFSAIAIVSFPTAKKDGLAYLFADAASKRAVQAAGAAVILLVWAFWIFCAPLWGVLAALLCVGWFLWFRRICMSQFGGVTGDLAGYFVQNLELILLFAAVLGGVFL